MKRKSRVKHHPAEWIFMGTAVVLGTTALSPSLPDSSNLPRLAFLAVALGLFFCFTPRLWRQLPRSLGTMALALLVLLEAASTVWAVNKGEALYDTARWVTAAALFLTFHHLYRRHPVRTIVVLSRAAAVIIVLSLTVAIHQTLQLHGDLQWDNRYSITSLYTHKGTFALLLLLMTLPIAMRLRLRLRKKNHAAKGKSSRMGSEGFYWTLLVLTAVALLFLAARTALLALAVLVVTLLITLIPIKPIAQRWRIPVTLGIALLLGVTLIGGTRYFCRLPLGETPGSGRGIYSSATLVERHALWKTTLRLIDKHPIVGVGAGNWKVCYPEVSTRDIFSVDVLDFTFTRPHNDYLRLLAETGYVGFFLLLLIVASLVTQALGGTAWQRRGGRMTGTALAWFAAVAVAALVDFPFDRTEMLLWCTITAAILSASTYKRCSPCFSLYPSFRFLAAMMMASVATLVLLRTESERQYNTITAANHAQRWSVMEKAAHKARTPLCSLTPIGTPLAYYEALAQEKQGKAAKATFAVALHDSPWHKQSLNDLGRLTYPTSPDSAKTLFLRAIEVSPSFSYAHFNLAQLFLQEHKPAQAREVLLAYDLNRKQERINALVWHYHQGETALYYQHKLVPAEGQMRDQLLKWCDLEEIQ